MISLQHLYFDNRPAGFGKTWAQLNRICRTPDLYIFAVDRIELVAERRRSLEEMARQENVSIKYVEVHSLATEGSVRVAFEALAGTFQSGHVVAFVTHTALMSAELKHFRDWHCIIDEAPSLWDRCSLATKISAPLLPQLFDLGKAQVGSEITPRRRVSRRDVQLDTLAGPLATLYSRAASPSFDVLTHLTSWSELASCPQWTWWSLWRPEGLAVFKSVVLLAAAFERSLTANLCRSLAPHITWQPLTHTADERTYVPRSLTIHYFAEQHHASRYRFASASGIAGLRKIAQYLGSRPYPRIWTCNSADQSIFDARPLGQYLRPRQGGTNRWAHIDEAAIIYTAKPDTFERSILGSLNVDPCAVIETREHDTIYQFVARTSLRDPASPRAVAAYVYDRGQAEALSHSLACRSGLNVELKLIDLGFAHDAPRRRSLGDVSEEGKRDRQRAQARDRKRRERERARARRDK